MRTTLKNRKALIIRWRTRTAIKLVSLLLAAQLIVLACAGDDPTSIPEPTPPPTESPSPTPSPGPVSTPEAIPETGDLQTTSLSVTPSLIFPGGEVTVDAEVVNAGEEDGEFLISLTVDGVETDNRPITLPSGESASVSFSMFRDTPGDYEIGVGGMSSTLTVPEVTTYTSGDFYYTISHPSDWVLDDSNPSLISIRMSDAIVIQLGVSQASSTMSLDENWQRLLDELNSSFDDLEITSRTPVQEDGKTVGYSFEGRVVESGESLRGQGKLISKGRRTWTILATSPEAVYDANSPLVDATIESFTLPVIATQTYSNSTEGFSLALPAGWEALETGKDFPFLDILSPSGEPIVIAGIQVGRLGESRQAEDQALYRMQVLYQNEPGFQIRSQGDVSLGPDTEGYAVVFSYDSGQGYDLMINETTVIRGSQNFLIYAFGLPSTFESESDEIEALFSSFTLEEPRPLGISRQDSLFLLGGEILTLDPALTRGSAEGIPGAIFSGLVSLDRDLRVVPELAERWEVSADGTVYTFYLRDGLRFHDGRPVTAQDVKYSWERAADPATESPTASTYLGDIVGVKEKLDGMTDEIAGVQVIDTHTLRVEIDGAKSYFLQKLTYPTSYVVDRANVQSGKTWTQRANGTGPFKLKEWVEDELLILERNAEYYLEVPRLAHVVYQLFAGSPMIMYEQDEIDVTEINTANIDRVLDPTNPLNQDLVITSELCTFYLAFNVTIPPFDDVKVRQAFATAIDADRWLEVTLKDIPIRASSILPPDMPGYNDSLVSAAFNPDLASQLIAESKYGSVEGLPAITTYNTSGTFISMWRDNLGVDVQSIELQELQEYFDKLDRRELSVWDAGWCADYPDPQNFLEILFHSESEENHFAYSDPDVDQGLAEAAVEQDESTRMALYRDIERAILDDWVAVPLTHGREYVLIKPHVKNYFVAPMGIHVLKDVYIERE